MTEFTKRPDGLIVPAGINRRGFLAGTAALGLAAGIGSSIGLGEARAQEPKRGGHLKLGLDGGATTDSLDPASYSGSVSFVIGHLWGDTLVESHPETGAPLPAIASSWESSADAS
ncbi:twin-arginine translocation signal domain-containing protein, partial [Sinorhizobium meliloti]